jgi:hypothetical protein
MLNAKVTSVTPEMIQTQTKTRNKMVKRKKIQLKEKKYPDKPQSYFYFRYKHGILNDLSYVTT